MLACEKRVIRYRDTQSHAIQEGGILKKLARIRKIFIPPHI